MEDDARAALAENSFGDARQALTALDTACKLAEDRGEKTITTVIVEEAQQKKTLLYDKAGEEHYNVISAFIKSLRGSDPDAAVYWMTRMLEAGEEPLPLWPGSYALECRNGRLTLQAWDEKHNIARRVVGIDGDGPGRLNLRVERFGKRLGTVLLFDQARPGNYGAGRQGARLVFRELFRRFLRRQFPDWKLALLSTEADLEHSLSPAYPRALLRRGASGWAALGAPADSGNSSGALSFGLIWLDYLRRREKRLTVEGLALFLPEARQRTTCLRLRYLNPRAARFAVFVYSEDGCEQGIDPRDYGNLETRLEPCRGRPGSEFRRHDWLDRLSRLPDVEEIVSSDGSISLRVRGIEFARTAGDSLLYGIGQKRVAQTSNLGELQALARELARFRAPAAQDRSNPLYTCLPEAWLESRVRSGIEVIDAGLLSSPVYGQVPAFAGGQRGIIDLLAADGPGRLAVLELKASADLHLPLQALDYWMRVRWHVERNEFTARGYFPGRQLSREPPRLLLIAPALEFHPTTETLLRYFSPEIPVERIGLGMEWQRELKVVFRIEGAERPGMS